MAKIQLTQELVRGLFDYKDGKLFWKQGGYGRKLNIEVGNVRKINGYFRRTIKIKDKCYYASRLIFLYHNGYLPKEVDHKNHNTLDNKIENLRSATRRQNILHRRKRTNVIGSKYIGVKQTNRSRTWYFRITSEQGIRLLFSSFKTEESAALAYNRMAVKYYGEFAVLNIIQP